MIKVGVIGVGSIGQHHARIFSGLDGVELVGIVILIKYDQKNLPQNIAAVHTVIIER